MAPEPGAVKSSANRVENVAAIAATCGQYQRAALAVNFMNWVPALPLSYRLGFFRL